MTALLRRGVPVGGAGTTAPRTFVAKAEVRSSGSHTKRASCRSPKISNPSGTGKLFPNYLRMLPAQGRYVPAASSWSKTPRKGAGLPLFLSPFFSSASRREKKKKKKEPDGRVSASSGVCGRDECGEKAWRSEGPATRRPIINERRRMNSFRDGFRKVVAEDGCATMSFDRRPPQCAES